MFSSRNHNTELEWAVARSLGIPKITTIGSSLKICLVAEGQAEVSFNPSNRTWEWDICASDIIIQEAGGIFTDIDGRQIIYNKKDPRNLRGYAATNGLVHDELIAEIKKLSS